MVKLLVALASLTSLAAGLAFLHPCACEPCVPAGPAVSGSSACPLCPGLSQGVEAQHPDTIYHGVQVSSSSASSSFSSADVHAAVPLRPDGSIDPDVNSHLAFARPDGQFVGIPFTADGRMNASDPAYAAVSAPTGRLFVALGPQDVVDLRKPVRRSVTTAGGEEYSIPVQFVPVVNPEALLGLSGRPTDAALRGALPKRLSAGVPLSPARDAPRAARSADLYRVVTGRNGVAYAVPLKSSGRLDRSSCVLALVGGPGGERSALSAVPVNATGDLDARCIVYRRQERQDGALYVALGAGGSVDFSRAVLREVVVAGAVFIVPAEPKPKFDPEHFTEHPSQDSLLARVPKPPAARLRPSPGPSPAASAGTCPP